MQPAICLDPLYPGLSAEQKVARIADAGFQYVDFWDWRDKHIPALAEACKKHGVQVVNFNGHRRGSPVAAHTHAELMTDITDAVAAARQLDCRMLMLLTNALNPGGSAMPFDDIPAVEKRTNAVTAFKKVLASTPTDIHFVLEPLNTKVDHPGYWLTDIPTAAALVHEVNDPRLRVLCDLYHMGMMGHDLEAIIKDFGPLIGYYHIADFPGRHEPGTGVGDWRSLLRLIRHSGFDGYVSFEYFPKDDSTESLKIIWQFWNDL